MMTKHIQKATFKKHVERIFSGQSCLPPKSAAWKVSREAKGMCVCASCFAGGVWNRKWGECSLWTGHEDQSNVLTTSFELQEEREGSRPTSRHYGFGANVEEGTSGAQRRLERSSNERRRWQSSDEQSSEDKRQWTKRQNLRQSYAAATEFLVVVIEVVERIVDWGPSAKERERAVPGCGLCKRE